MPSGGVGMPTLVKIIKAKLKILYMHPFKFAENLFWKKNTAI